MGDSKERSITDAPLFVRNFEKYIMPMLIRRAKRKLRESNGNVSEGGNVV